MSNPETRPFLEPAVVATLRGALSDYDKALAHIERAAKAMSWREDGGIAGAHAYPTGQRARAADSALTDAERGLDPNHPIFGVCLQLRLYWGL